MSVEQRAWGKHINPPGPAGDPLGLRGMQEFRHDSLAYLTKMARTYGDVVRFRLGPPYTYMVAHPDYVHQILVDDADKYHKTDLIKRVLGPSLGNGLLLNEDESWRKQRRMMQPAFHARRIDSYAQVMVDFAVRTEQEWQRQPGQTRDVHHDMMHLTLGVVAKTLFDADVTGDADQISAAITLGLQVTNAKFSRIIPIPDWLPTRTNRRGKQSQRIIDDLLMGFIRDRRASGEDKGDLLSMLLMAVDDGGGMTDAQLLNESFTLFVAGHETTANALTWTWYLLSQNPQAADRLHEELDRVLAGRTPTMQDLPNLPYTDAVIKESMRLYPPAWTVGRQPVVDVEVGGFTIPAGSGILISQYVLHRDPRYFAEPEQFRPERWADSLEKRLPRYAYFPFGAGPRVCIGNSFALMEARLVLAEMAQHYSPRLVPGHVVGTEPIVTLRPRGGMPMVIEQRSPTA
jgi:cytochrome P450